MGVFPGVVHPESDISPELRAHFRYPEDLFKVQRDMLAKYHVDDPREFFTNNDFWSVPTDPTTEAGNFNQPPYYVLTGGPDGRPQFDLTSAMSGFNRQFLSAYISACSDPSCYGQISVLELPTDSQTQGPQQVQSIMTANPQYAKERTQIQGTNQVHFGNLLTLPIARGGVLYVEPMYTERSGDNAVTFPLLSRVLVAYQGPNQTQPQVGYAPTYAEALAQLFGADTASAATAPGGDATPRQGGATVTAPQLAPPPDTASPGAAPPAAPAPPDQAATLQALRQALDSLDNARRSGDLADLGKAEQQVVDAAKALTK
jgi:uncharacterized membrane protein (UPF0182 family)